MEEEEAATLAELEAESWYLSVLIMVLFVLSIMKAELPVCLIASMTDDEEIRQFLISCSISV